MWDEGVWVCFSAVLVSIGYTQGYLAQLYKPGGLGLNPQSDTMWKPSVLEATRLHPVVFVGPCGCTHTCQECAPDL